MTLRQHLTEVESKIGCRQANAATTGEARSKREKTTGIFAHQAMRFVEELENELRQGHFESWKAVVDKVASLDLDPLIAKAANARMSKSQGTDQKSYVPMPGDSLQTQLEGTYQNLQLSLTQLRHAVATAIATEKQLEQQLQKNKDQADTWLKRATMAEQQKNSELVVQARQRMDQYVRAAGELQEQLLIQKESTSTLRQRLTDHEAQVQKAYTKKQVLIARDKAANAILKTNEALQKTDIPAAIAALTAMETSVIEQEKAASASTTSVIEQEKAASASTTSVVKLDMPIDRQFLADTIATFETAIEAIRQLDQRIADNDKSQKQADLE
jgi:phage shock protein A